MTPTGFRYPSGSATGVCEVSEAMGVDEAEGAAVFHGINPPKWLWVQNKCGQPKNHKGSQLSGGYV